MKTPALPVLVLMLKTLLSCLQVAIAAALERELPPGWQLYTQCRVVGLDGEVFK